MAPLDLAPLPAPADLALDRAAELNRRFEGTDAAELIALSVETLFPGRIAMVSSFGAESSVLLHLLAQADPNVPVIFIDTGRLFAETLEYRSRLGAELGLTDIRTVGPSPERAAELDPHRALWMVDPDLCCHFRKAEPLAGAVQGFDAWFTGRKRFQSASRAAIPLFEADGARIKVNPLATWSGDALRDYIARHDLPPHPLVAKGYPSIGCVPCTDRVKPGEDQRSGRWRGTGKTECGIHLGLENDGSGI